jgi:hypothetical protein
MRMYTTATAQWISIRDMSRPWARFRSLALSSYYREGTVVDYSPLAVTLDA